MGYTAIRPSGHSKLRVGRRGRWDESESRAQVSRGYAVHAERAAEMPWYRSRRRSETRLVAVGGVTRDVDAAIHDRRVHLLAKGLGWAKGNVERPRDTDRRERRGRRLGRWRGLGAAQAGNVGATASHSQNPVTVLHTDPTQLEQLSEHGHPLGIVKGPLQPGGMTG